MVKKNSNTNQASLNDKEKLYINNLNLVDTPYFNSKNNVMGREQKRKTL